MQNVTIQTIDDNGNVVKEETSAVVRISGPHQLQEMLDLMRGGMSFEEAAAVIEAA